MYAIRYNIVVKKDANFVLIFLTVKIKIYNIHKITNTQLLGISTDKKKSNTKKHHPEIFQKRNIM